jgi:peptide/nickel transport system permease protein
VTRFIFSRLLVVLAVALTLSVVAFFLLNIAVDPAQAIAGEEADYLEIEQVRQRYGLDRPIIVRYLEWFSGIFRGDFGTSYYWNKPVGQLVLERAPETITLALMSVVEGSQDLGLACGGCHR